MADTKSSSTTGMEAGAVFGAVVASLSKLTCIYGALTVRMSGNRRTPDAQAA